MPRRPFMKKRNEFGILKIPGNLLLSNSKRKFTLRIPSRNELPHRKIKIKLDDARGKHSVKKLKILKHLELKKLEDLGIKNKNVSGFSTDICCNLRCGASADDNFTHNEEYQVVCKVCGAVQASEVFFEGEINSLQKIDVSSPEYKSRTYRAEIIRAWGNCEPRIPREDYLLIRQTYDKAIDMYNKVKSNESLSEEEKQKVLHTTGLEYWASGDTEGLKKREFKRLLQTIDHFSEKIKGKTNFTKKYLERWLQFKIEINSPESYSTHVAKIPDQTLMSDVFDLSNIFDKTFIDNKEVILSSSNSKISMKKKSSLSLPLCILIVLYNISKDTLRHYGWYFVNENIYKAYHDTNEKRKKKSSLFKDFEIYKLLINFLNLSIQKHPFQEYFQHCKNILDKTRNNSILRIPNEFNQLIEYTKFSYSFGYGF